MLKNTMITGLVLTGLLTGCADKSGFEVDEQYLTIGSVDVTPVADTEFSSHLQAQAVGSVNCSSLNKLSLSQNFASLSDLQDVKNPLDPINEFELKLDQVINIGKKIWAIVEKGRPVVNISADVATAMPSGAGCWTDLQGWSMPQSQSYVASYKNLYGVEVVKHVYRVSYLAGGSVNGKGKYIGYATVLPVEVNVAWGYTFNSEAKVPTVFNMGTSANPKAGMQVNVSWKVNTVLKSIQATDSYAITGVGELKKMK